MPYTDASTVLLKKLATYLADDENSGAADIIRGWTPRRAPARAAGSRSADASPSRPRSSGSMLIR